MIYLILFMFYFTIKYLIQKFLIKRKAVYCYFCKYYMPFISLLCQPDCYHNKNLILDEDDPIRKVYRTKYLDEKPLTNETHSCKYFKIGILYKIYLYIKIFILMRPLN